MGSKHGYWDIIFPTLQTSLAERRYSWVLINMRKTPKNDHFRDKNNKISLKIYPVLHDFLSDFWLETIFVVKLFGVFLAASKHVNINIDCCVPHFRA